MPPVRSQAKLKATDENQRPATIGRLIPLHSEFDQFGNDIDPRKSTR
jgi:hypothetical protein